MTNRHDPELVEAAERLRDEPAHYFDCDRFQVYDWGTRTGDCDCTHDADARTVLDAIAAQPAPVADRDALAEALYRDGDLGPGYMLREDCEHLADRVLASGVVQDAAEVRAQERRKVAEEIAAAHERTAEDVARHSMDCDDDATVDALRWAARIAREHAASDREASDG